MSKDALKDLEERISYSLSHRNEIPCTTSQVDLPSKSDYRVFFVYLSGDKLYTASGNTLYVYLVSDTTAPIATYSLSAECYSGMISDVRLYSRIPQS